MGVTIDAHMCFDSQFPLSRPEEEHWVRVPPALEVFLTKKTANFEKMTKECFRKEVVTPKKVILQVIIFAGVQFFLCLSVNKC